MQFNYVWQEIEALKRRVSELERQGLEIIEDSWELLNDEDREAELRKIVDEIRQLVKKHGQITITVITKN